MQKEPEEKILRGITITELPDGSWSGELKQGEKVVNAREAAPEYTLQALLTHP